MGSTKNYLMAMEEERFEAWAAEHYPDVEPDTPEWDTIGLYYSDWQDFLAEESWEAYQQQKFSISLNSIPERYSHAMQELRQLHVLLDAPQPEIAFRMAWVHAVTVMEAYLMYCARALLEHDWPLRRFRDEYFRKVAMKSRRVSAADRKAAAGDDILLFRPAAQAFVSGMTFHNVKTIENYFCTVLHVPPVWPLEPLKQITQIRNHLVHRNGVDDTDAPVTITLGLLRHALQKVYELIEAADMSIRLEADYFGNWRNEENREILASALRVARPPGADS